MLFNCFEAWQDDYYDAREEKQAAAAKIQALRRGQLKRRGLQEQMERVEREGSATRMMRVLRNPGKNPLGGEHLLPPVALGTSWAKWCLPH